MTHLNRSSNQRVMNNILQTHLNNINILASSIQNSQELITRMQRETIINNNRTSNITNTIFDNIFNDDINTPTTRTQRRNSNLDNNGANNGANNETNNENNTTNREVGNDFTYYFTFDTLGSSASNITNLYTSGGISFETLVITEDNKNIMNHDVSQNTTRYHLYEIRNFDLIENPINDLCPITRDRFDSTTENVLMIKNCKHIFNKSALNMWLEENRTCPCCRGRVG